MEANEALMPYSRKNVVGEGVKGVSKEAKPFVNVCKRINDYKRITAVVVHCKAVRRVGSYLNLKIGVREIEALCFVSEWCVQFNKDGGPVSKIVGWSGYTRNWKARINASLRDCVELGLLEEKPVRGGVRLVITRMGKSVLDTLDLMSDRVLQEMQDKQVTT